MARVFLSYAWEDQLAVEGIYQRLKAEGFEPWMDKIDLLAGQDWQVEINKALADSDFVLVFLSNASMARQGHFHAEFQRALTLLESMPPGTIHTVPVRLDPCDPPPSLQHLNWVNLFDDDGFERIVRALRAGERGRNPSRKRRRTLIWTREHKLAVISIVIAAISAVAAVVSIPVFQRFIAAGFASLIAVVLSIIGTPAPTYTLTVLAMPSDSTVAFINTNIVYSPGMELKPGVYILEVQREGYEPVRKQVKINDHDVALDIRLHEITYALTINAVPKDSQIVLLDSDTLYYPGMKLPPGTYRIKVSRESYPDTVESILITNANVYRSITLQPKASITNSIGMEFVLIPAGQFMMGTPRDQLDAIEGHKTEYCNTIEDEAPQHWVKISKPFYMGIHEVTQAQWKAVMDTDPSHFKGDALPVENVSWNDVQEFIKKLNRKEKKKEDKAIFCRLPTEAEWEYATRAGTTSFYSFGDDAKQLGDYAWYGENSDGTTHPVGKRNPNAWDLHDMQGNVYEWVQDWHAKQYYEKSPNVDPLGPEAGKQRVIRGGHWANPHTVVRPAYRNCVEPSRRERSIGFRCLSSGRESSRAKGKP